MPVIIHTLEACNNENSSSMILIQHFIPSFYGFAGTFTKPSTICQNSSVSMLAALAQYSMLG